MKLDELIRALQQARTHLVQMEEFTDEQLEALQKEFQEHRDNASSKLAQIQETRRRRPRSPSEL